MDHFPDPNEIPPLDRRYKAFRDALDGAYWLGHDHGWERRGEHIEHELRDQLEHEIERWDPDCPLCVARRRIRELENEARVTKYQLLDLERERRGGAIRAGERGYRETKPPPPPPT